jgi:hypothetical protein
MMALVLTPLLLLASSSVEDTRVILEQGIATVESDMWSKEARCTKKDTVLIHVNMVVANVKQLEATFWAVSDPHNVQYGKHLSLEELAKLVGSSAESLTATIGWLESAGEQSLLILFISLSRPTRASDQSPASL